MFKYRSSILIWFLFVLILLYQAKGVLYTEGIISQVIALVELFICSLFIIKLLFSLRVSNVVRILLLLLIVVSLSFVFSPKIVYASFIGKTNTFTFFREIIGCILPFFPVYYYARGNRMSLLPLRFFLIVLLIITILLFFHNYQDLASEKDSIELTNNFAYRFVGLLPYLFFFRKKWAMSVICIVLPLVLLGAKRGAIVCFFFGVFLYAIFYLRSDKHHLRNYLVCLIILSLLLTLSLYLYNTDPYLQLRVEETLDGNTSSRDYLLNKLILHWKNDNDIVHYLFGFGFCATMKVAGNYAHNDWAEFLFDMGILGFFLYFIFYVLLFRQIKKCNSMQIKYAFIMLLMLLFLKSIMSMGVMTEPSCVYFILLGYLIGVNELNKKNDGKTNTTYLF